MRCVSSLFISVLAVRARWAACVIAPAGGLRLLQSSLQVQVLGELYDRTMVAGGGGGGQLAAGPFMVFDTPRRTRLQRRQQHQHCHHQRQNEPAGHDISAYEAVATSSCFWYTRIHDRAAAKGLDRRAS